MTVSTLIMSLFVATACGSGPEPVPTAVTPPKARPGRAPAENGVPARVVALGDLHADLDAALAVLRMTGLVDAEGRWSGADTVLVQTGDTTDRGPDSRAVLELLIRLSAEAEAAGGQVVSLLGNHEVMNLHGDWRYVSSADVAAFGTADARRDALAPSGALGSWLRERDVVARVGDTVYAHGGITAVWARQGLPAINAAASEAMRLDPRAAVLGEEGPLWFRGYLLTDPTLACDELRQALDALGARRMVVGHTTQRSGRIAVRCGGALIGIDTGISAHYGGNRAALELRSGDAWAIYPGGPEDLPDPAPVAGQEHSR